MNLALEQALQPCVKRTVNALRVIAYVCGFVSFVALLAALLSIRNEPQVNGAMLGVVLVLLTMVGGSYALYWVSSRKRTQLEHVLFKEPQSIVKIQPIIIHHKPFTTYMFHFHANGAVKKVGINVPNRRIFEQLMQMLPVHCPQAVWI